MLREETKKRGVREMRPIYGLLLALIVPLVVLTASLVNPLIATAAPPAQGAAYARTNIANPLGMVVAWTKSGGQVVFTDVIQRLEAKGTAWTCCGWFVRHHTKNEWYQAKYGGADHHWELAHGICLPFIGCIVDRQVQYDAGVFIRITQYGGTYYCDAFPTGQYSYLVTQGRCI